MVERSYVSVNNYIEIKAQISSAGEEDCMLFHWFIFIKNQIEKKIQVSVHFY